MSWFWSSSSSSDGETKKHGGTSSKGDVYADLDPELQAFARASTKEQADVPVQSGSDRQVPLNSASSTDEQSLGEELSRVISSSKSRKAQINAGAMFNCAIAEYELNECFTSGSWWDKSKLCEPQKNAFWDCLESNKKALKILGYAETGNTDAQNVKILEVADDLCLKELAARRLEKQEKENAS
ncbi:Putative uncharacterized protein [Taphrina deformans PYCC 5710]|uniref:Uncharacterized protein n=1 Tax=Taphrina deformans (strain PYCC 5710 / ATCC 11124 / CBS 356.35 / IMI 108563 / JCM 9778 / NBRC 8474) TaxID=1097556 RepID=R4XEA7_TAPDE|nr:Putative uncharacterized protein [Taphrina deformans PYCC 5710]|eukprot:CCG82801.1 Putative uncharacterized protein [Taphrina deformans PYCC 5710]